jgi:protease-4
MKQFLITLAAVFAALCLFFVGLPLILAASLVAAARPQPTAERTILDLDLREPMTDQETANPLFFLGRRSLSVVGVVRTLDRARDDPKVRGLYLRLPEGGLSPAAADEIRTAVEAFRSAGKPVLAHSQGIYPSGDATATYLLGAASGDFWMQPGASLQSVGLAVEETFFKRAFDRFGVEADYEQRYQYKNAVNPFLYDDFTPAHREGELGWLRSIYDTQLAEAAHDRGKAPEAFRAVLEAGPYSAEDALKAGLIDHVGEERAAEESLLARAGQGAKLTELAAYAAPDGVWRGARRLGTGPALALIPAEGEIVTGAPRGASLGGSSTIYSDQVSKAFYDAVADADVKAIVFRVSSPGGSDTASEQILSALRAAKAAGKPVVVSMGAYAASGGYWISSEASEIVAEPTTLTGSIGVFGGKFVIGPALAKIGVDTRGLSVGGAFASAFGSAAPFTPQQKAKLSAWMDRIYDGFIARVAAGRRLAPDRVREIAKGRVWTGAQAKDLGLVDKIGGLDLAIADAARLGGLSGSSGPRLIRFPGPETAFGMLGRAAGAAAEIGAAAETARALLSSGVSAETLRALDRARRSPEEQ